jgi:phage/plasmid primase-like uncharacterized protein
MNLRIAPAVIEQARAVPIKTELERRGIRLRGRKQLAGPCPKCGGRDRFGVNTSKQVWICRICRVGGDVIRLVRHIDGSGFIDAVELLAGKSIDRPQALRPQPLGKDSDNRDTAAWLWSKRQPVTEDTPVARYLRERKYTGQIPATIGYLPARGSHSDAMIAAFGLATEVEPRIIAPPAHVIGVHLTRLTPDGSKTDVDPVKIMLGPSLGQPIVLSPPNDLLGIAIVEGLETGFSVYESTGLGVWVAGAAGRMPPLADAIPSYIETITICQENDAAGRRGAEELARRLIETRDIEIFVTEAF